ncbi:MAG: hypothetical protein AAF599_12850, partial [Bacteroidota bacterium]
PPPPPPPPTPLTPHPSDETDTGWREIADFQYYGIRNITRLALSDDGKIAVVTEGSVPNRF